MTPSRLGEIWPIFVLVGAALLAAGIFYGVMRRFRSRNLSLADKIALPLLKSGRPLVEAPDTRHDTTRRRKSKPGSESPPPSRKSIPPAGVYRREFLENSLSLVAIVGDFAMIVLGFVLASLLCQSNLLPARLASQPMPLLNDSYKVIVCASLIVLWGLSGRGLYYYRSLLLPSKIWHKFVEALGFCLLALVCLSLLMPTNPVIPWPFFACSAFIIFLNIYNWRMVLARIVQHPIIASRLRRRLVVIGAGSQTRRIQRALHDNSDMAFVGWVQANKPNHITELEEWRLGGLHELEKILHEHAVNIAVLTESESLQREGVLAVAKACENEYVQFKMVPHFFEILISGLRPENIGGIQLLGIESLPLTGYRNRVLKRAIDIAGALAGLSIAIPLILVFGAVVFWESPGPILYKQLRLGRNGRPFYIIKIRSMKINAEAPGRAQWAQQDDNRRLRVGAFMRKYNIDEVPQFWNVLKGDMSLVGPRPERPELIARFKSKVPHYQARHRYRPGITGWAQVNGWRGNTDLEERIRHDIWYLENWSVWLDFRIMLQTFYRRENAY
jgi:exopolysaccharide biosynthesis polyprenyl glycosylphosphotransferase